GGVELGQQSAGDGQELFTVDGGVHPASRALEKPHPESLLDLEHRAADRGLGDVELSGRAGVAARIGDGGHGTQVSYADVYAHGASMYAKLMVDLNSARPHTLDPGSAAGVPRCGCAPSR